MKAEGIRAVGIALLQSRRIPYFFEMALEHLMAESLSGSSSV
jgi:hypothetical protein